MAGLRAVLLLVRRRASNRPARWLLTALGIAAATAYGGAIVAEATIAGDEAARASLRSVPVSELVVRISASGVVTPAAQRSARSALRRLGLSASTEVVLLNPVRLGPTVVRPAAIEPLSRWARPAPPTRCRPGSCPMLALGASLPLETLRIPGLRLPVPARSQLHSAAPLGFSAAVGAGAPTVGGQPPVLITGDPTGLEHLSALSGIYRTHSWFSVLSPPSLHAWQLAALQSRLQQTQTELAQTAGGLSLSAPFTALAAARNQADRAPGRLLLAGGGAVAVLALFLALAAGMLHHDQAAELERLESAGALATTVLGFVASEALLVCAVGVLSGAAMAMAIATILAHSANLPAGAVLDHSLLTTNVAAGMGLGWLGCSALIILLLTQRGSGLADAAAAAAVAALALALAGGAGNDTLTLLLAPLACLAGAVLVARGGAAMLRAAERLTRAGPPVMRLAFIGLARAPLAPSLAIAFLAVSTSIGGFALSYRATLLRGAADQASDRVPLDAVVAPSADFTTPLALAPLTRWRALAGGAAFEVRRTDGTYVAGAGSITVPVLGVPAGAVLALHGWRSSDASASLVQMSRALAPAGPARAPGPMLPSASDELTARVSARGLGLNVIADLRGPDGEVRQVPLAVAGTHAQRHAHVPFGRWELESFELREPTGLEITDGHQNGENLAAATQFSTTVEVTQVQVVGHGGRVLRTISLRGWRAVGAATDLRPGAAGVRLRFATSGAGGVLRPEQPSDLRPLPVLVDPGTAAAADGQHRLELTADGAPISVRVAAVLRRFPTVAPGGDGFVVADESALAGALDAWLPGQGRSDELWLTSPRPAGLRRALLRTPLSQLSSRLRVELERALRSAGVARAIQGSLLAAAGLSAGLALIGVLVSMLGSAAEKRVSDDLAGQGVGAGARRSELRLRALFTGVAGCLAGLVMALVLTPLAVGAVRSAEQASDPRPPLVAVTPWLLLIVWCLIMLGAALVAGALGSVRRASREAIG